MTTSVDLLRSETGNYIVLAEQLKGSFPDIDDDTLRDTLEGLSDLPDLIKEVVRSSVEDEFLAGALKSRIADMQSRLERLGARANKKREVACWAMSTARLDRLIAEDFSVSLRLGAQRLEIMDEGQIPNEFLVPVRPRLDRAGIIAKLKQGWSIPGATLIDGAPHISVRVK